MDEQGSAVEMAWKVRRGRLQSLLQIRCIRVHPWLNLELTTAQMLLLGGEYSTTEQEAVATWPFRQTQLPLPRVDPGCAKSRT